KRLLLHWGVRRQKTQTSWDLPPQPAWPPEAPLAVPGAVQSPFSRANGNVNLVIHLSPAAGYEALEFALFFPEEKRWDNNGGRNYQIRLAEPSAPSGSPVAPLRARLAGQGNQD